MIEAFLDQHMLYIAYDAECDGELYLPLSAFESEWISRDLAHGLCRSLATRGFMQFKCGLRTEDGEVAGSGYGITKAGLDYLNQLRADPKTETSA